MARDRFSAEQVLRKNVASVTKYSYYHLSTKGMAMLYIKFKRQAGCGTLVTVLFAAGFFCVGSFIFKTETSNTVHPTDFVQVFTV